MSRAWLVGLGLMSACGGFAPFEGVWVLGETELLSDSCDFPAMEDDTGGGGPDDTSFRLTLTDDGFQVLGDSDDAEPIMCVLDGKDFTCDNVTKTVSEGASAVTQTETSKNSGTFASDVEVTITVANTINCEGTECDQIAAQLGTSFPCTIRGRTGATAVE